MRTIEPIPVQRNRAGRMAGAVLLGLATAVLVAPAASAQEGAPYLLVNGESVLQPGQELKFQGFCPAEGASVTSPVLTDLEMLHDPSVEGPNLNGSGDVVEGTEPGTYAATMDCDGESYGLTFTVGDAGSTPDPELFIIGDGRPQPGDAIEVAVRCDGEVGQPSSPVLDIGSLSEVESPGELPVFVAPATIAPDTEPGEYPLSSTCAGEDLGIGFLVFPAGGDDDAGDGDGDGSGDGEGDGDGTDGSSDGDQAGTQDGEPQVTRVPAGAPETGAADQGRPVATLLAATALLTVGGAAALRRWARR